MASRPSCGPDARPGRAPAGSVLASIAATTVGTMAELQRLDGRRARREQNVDAVVDAMLDLLGEGHLTPGAAAVAERSGVSLRSVFRYFDDMDSLTERAIARQMERAAPLFDLLDDDGPLDVRAGRLASHRAVQYNRLAPFARVAIVRSAAVPGHRRGPGHPPRRVCAARWRPSSAGSWTRSTTLSGKRSCRASRPPPPSRSWTCSSPIGACRRLPSRPFFGGPCSGS